ncbi:FMN-linked oxidoreductase [Roridomyces roridus]|uniref:FMN-linked oxidoreductase n=1 Tax=Roridomyces roridus TaxID=1738132 RepID=A0AAD7FNZ5_9AGAR|nr:FMN-linked oxidoreductase [Roridomyces roridus]
MSNGSKLFQPVQVGPITLRHRVVLAPSTLPSPIMAEYYGQRARAKGTLLIAEPAFIAPKAGGFIHVPGIWSDEQIAGWKQVTDAVHARGSYVFLQLWALGRTAYPEYLGPGEYVSASAATAHLPFHGGSALRSTSETARELSVEEIAEYVQLYAQAASNAVHKAGFDGVEVHGANGYLPEQFLADNINQRTDAYGGSVENRARFVFEVIDGIAAAIGAPRTAIRLSPWSKLQGCVFEDPKATYTCVVQGLRDRHPDLGYIHVIEDYYKTQGGSNDFIREIWGERPLISAGGYSQHPELGFRVAEEKGDIVAFSKAFIANPDLPCRLFHGKTLLEGDSSRYYTYGTDDPTGYTDYQASTYAVSAAA